MDQPKHPECALERVTSDELWRAPCRIFFNLTLHDPPSPSPSSPSHLVCHLLCGVTGANGSYHSICIFVHSPQYAARFHLPCQGFCPFLQAAFRFPATAALRTQGTASSQTCLYHQLIVASRNSSSVSRVDRLCSTVSTLLPEPSPLLWVPRVVTF